MKVTCCKDCTERHFKCHSDCVKYCEEVERNEELKKKARNDEELRLYKQQIKNKVKR